MIRPGAHVKLVGLRAREDMNGEDAVVQKFMLSKQRWAVKVSTEETLAVKPENIRVHAVQPDGVPGAKIYLDQITPPGTRYLPRASPFIIRRDRDGDLDVRRPDPQPPPPAEWRAVRALSHGHTA